MRRVVTDRPSVERVDGLPHDLEPLCAESKAEGFEFVERLHEDWTTGRNRFDARGEAFFAARVEGRLVGVCGLNRDPFTARDDTGRLRRLYVLPGYRRQGIAGDLTRAALRLARENFDLVRLRSLDVGGRAFYEAFGFTPTSSEPEATHVIELSKGPVEVRLLRSDEAELLMRAAPGVFDEDPVDAYSAEFASDPRHHLAVALEAGRVVGMASAVHYVHPDKAPELWINEVGVSGMRQGEGIGKRLLQALFEQGRSLGCVEAWVTTEQDNVRARSLYRSAGGAEEAITYVTFDLAVDTDA